LIPLIPCDDLDKIIYYDGHDDSMCRGCFSCIIEKQQGLG